MPSISASRRLSIGRAHAPDVSSEVALRNEVAQGRLIESELLSTFVIQRELVIGDERDQRPKRARL